MDAAQTTAALHRAMVEVFALKQAGRSLLEVSLAKPGRNATEKVQITPSTSGVNLQFAEGGSLEQVVESLAPEKALAVVKPAAMDPEASVEVPPEFVAEQTVLEPTAEVQTAARALTSKLVSFWDPSWLQISLADPEIKFAVCAAPNYA